MFARMIPAAVLLLAFAPAAAQAQTGAPPGQPATPGIDTRDTSSTDRSALPGEVAPPGASCVDRVTGAVRSGRPDLRFPGAAPAGIAPPQSATGLPPC